jgi:hypothetical protein
MPTDNLTLAARRELIEHIATDIYERGHFADRVLNGSAYGYAGFVRQVRSGGPALLDEAQRGLGELEDKMLASERIQRHIEDMDRRRAEQERPLTEEERAVLEREWQAAAERAAEHNSTESRLGRIEAVLERIASGLEKR